jgi:hypothetical protein
MKSVKGNSSSKKVTIPPILPILPLYMVVIRYPAMGAQTTSENSPISGTVNESKPIASKTIPKIRFRVFFPTRFFGFDRS